MNKNQECFLICCFPIKMERKGNLENVKVWEWYAAAAAAPHDPPITLIDCSYIWWIWLCRNVISLQQRQLSLKERISPDFTAYIHTYCSRWWFSFHLTMESCQQSLLCNLYVSESSNWTEHSGMSKALSPFKKKISECKTILISIFGLMSWKW